MKILGIDTTRKIAKVFVLDTKDSDNSVFIDMAENIRHSEGLFLYIEKLMYDTKLSIADLDGFACVVGPGSFTGIRVGMSTIKGFNKVENKSIVSMNMFEVLSQSVKNGIVLLNSTNTSCYYAKIKNKKIIEDGVVDKSAIAELANGESVYILAEEQSLIENSYKDYKVISSLNELYESCIISKLNNMEYGEFLPYYLQLSQAERNLKND